MSKRQPKMKKTVSFSDVPKLAAVPEKAANDTWIPKLQRTIVTVPFHIPMLVFSLFAHFDITSNVAHAMTQSLVVLVLFQIVYSLILLQSVEDSPKKKKPKKRAFRSPDSSDFLYVTFACGVSLVATVPVFVVLILFGAPAASLLHETYLLAFHVSFLVLLPLLIVYKIVDDGVPAAQVWGRLLAFEEGWYKQPTFTMAIGGAVGAWLGAIPIPLDWDRNWQTWPITLLVGSYLGAFVGNCFGQVAALI